MHLLSLLFACAVRTHVQIKGRATLAGINTIQSPPPAAAMLLLALTLLALAAPRLAPHVHAARVGGLLTTTYSRHALQLAADDENVADAVPVARKGFVFEVG